MSKDMPPFLLHKERCVMQMDEFLRGLVPRSGELEAGVVSAGVGAVAYLIGWDGAVQALVICMAVDYVSGVLAAYVNPNLKLNSNIGFRGICKKLLILCVLAVTHHLAISTGQEFLHTLATWFFLGNEALSVLENAGKAGVPIPEKLKESLEQLRKGKKG